LRVKNPALPKAFGTGCLNVGNDSLSYSLVNPAVRLRRTGNALPIRFTIGAGTVPLSTFLAKIFLKIEVSFPGVLPYTAM